MVLSRRSLLAGGGVLLGAGLLSGCGRPDILARLAGGPQPPANWAPANDQLWHTLSRLSFGPRHDELAHAAAGGPAGWIEEQLAPETIDDLGAELRLQRLDTLQFDTSLLFDVREEHVRYELQQATILRAVYSRRQLYELTVDFWSDHFSISMLKNGVARLKLIDDREVIRHHALGRFDELLWASMSSPAMLVYLDNQENRAGNPNENYARELLELHSLGLDAGYSQRDVEETARCLTGWTVDEGLFRGMQRFAAELHDNGPKLVLGTPITAGGGAGDIERLHQLIMAHPALPIFIAGKLARRFVADEPPAALVQAAAESFRRSGGDIRTVLRSMLFSGEFAAAPPRFKRPLHWLAGALRQLGAESDGGPALHAALREMGQPLLQWPTPDGFPDQDAAWSGNLLPRWRTARRLAANQLAGTRIDLPGLIAAAGVVRTEEWLQQLAILLLGAALPAEIAGRLSGELGDSLNEERAAAALAIILAAPQYQWR